MIAYAAESAAAGQPTALLNMASFKGPGGGYLGGARAQEEQLCHRSDLQPLLKIYRHGLVDLRRGEPYLELGTAILTPRVELLYRGAGEDYAPQRPTCFVSVVSAAAWSYRRHGNPHADPDLVSKIDANWRAVLEAAAQSGAAVLVLAPLGCGAFHNPPDVVGASLVRALREASTEGRLGGLRKVALVVKEDHNSGGKNVDAFRAALAQLVAPAAPASVRARSGSLDEEEAALRPSKVARAGA